MLPKHLFVHLIPLPNVVFFPHSLLPLHIFEPRYRDMVEVVLAGDRLMGVPLLKPGWEDRYYDAPDVYRVLGIGKILEHEQLDNGNYNIWLTGVARARIIHEVQEKPFRVAKVESLCDGHHPAQSATLARARMELVESARHLARVCPAMRTRIHKVIDEHVYPGALADFLMALLCEDIYEKQCILSEPVLERRLRLATVQVHARFQEQVVREQTGNSSAESSA